MCTSIASFGSVSDKRAGMHLIVDDKGVFREDNFHKVFAIIMKITTAIMILQLCNHDCAIMIVQL